MLNRMYSTGRCYHNGEEIALAEYERLKDEYREKARYVDELFADRITIGDVPDEWQEEILRRVEERRQAAMEETELSAEEALDIILGGEGA